VPVQIWHGVLKNSYTKNGHKFWKCKCDCGKISYVPTGRLNSGHSKSCGCGIAESAIRRQWKGYGEISKSFWTRIKKNASVRKLKFKITIEEIWNLFLKQNRKCKLSGIKLCFPSRYKLMDGTASLDRINSELGYTSDNIQWIHKHINKMKMELDQDYFIQICQKISQYNLKNVTQQRIINEFAN